MVQLLVSFANATSWEEGVLGYTSSEVLDRWINKEVFFVSLL